MVMIRRTPQGFDRAEAAGLFGKYQGHALVVLMLAGWQCRQSRLISSPNNLRS
jgi:hypothetical protein